MSFVVLFGLFLLLLLWQVSKHFFFKRGQGRGAQQLVDQFGQGRQRRKLAACAGEQYDLYAYIRGELDADTTQGRFLIRAKFMDSNGASLGYSDITAMYPGAISSWTRVGGRVTAPANSVSMQVQYLLYQSSGWVNIDDVEVTIVAPNAATEVTKYYYFGGQRVAMRKNGVLTYLHADHLGSTVIETNITGTVTSDEKYLAYGKQRDSGKVTTDHRFTGQKEDASGLQYFNARFYDPVIGMFVSPDTIVPQPGLASDYNRYAYVRGRVMNANDPSGYFSEEDIPYLCKECKTWDDVWKFYGIGGDEYLQSIFQDSSFTFGSLVFTPDGGEYTLILAQQGSSGDMTFQGVGYGLAVWDNVNDTFASMDGIIAGTFAYWGTNSLDVDTPYSFGGTYGGWLPELAFAYKKPSQTGVNGFKDLGNVINPHGNERYHVHRDWCVLCLAGTVISYGFASVEKIEDAADLGTNLAQDLSSRENPWIDARYPVVDANFVDLYGNSRGGLPAAK